VGGHRDVRVLVVDDSAPDAALVSAALSRDLSSHFTVTRSATITDAVGVVAATHPDCVLLDLGLPDAEGLDGLAALHAAAPDTPVVVVTGWDDPETALAAIGAGAQDYLVKDRMDVELIGRSIRYAVSRHRAQVEIMRREREVRAARDALAASEMRYRTLLSVLNEGVILEDRDGRMIATNPAVVRILGRSFPGLRQCGWRMVRDDETDWPVGERPWEVARRDARGVADAVIGLERPDGPVVWLQLTSQPLVNPGEDQLHGLVTSFTDITASRAAHQRMEDLALHDPLTGLPNRAQLVTRIDRALRRIDRDGGNVAVLFLDLDGFKPVNDTHGHEAGDELLCQVGRRLVHALRPTDSAARIGGDEFVVVCDRVDSDDEAARVAERISEALAPSFRIGNAEVSVGVSIGFAVSTPTVRTAGELLRQADAAMFAVKRGRR
jgi:diguanylate cyclase (GGDEF)-like protein/PAS domain S-box-containing protein